MTTTLPKIWNTQKIPDPAIMKSIKFQIDGDELTYVLKYDRGMPMVRDEAPEYIFFRHYDTPERKKASLPDFFCIANGVLIVSQAFHDLLSQFDLGDGRMFEVPLYEHDQKTLRPGRWFILHVAAQKQTLIPEKSEHVRPVGDQGNWKAESIAIEPVLAVRASSAKGADIWMDRRFKSRMFLTDRLKSAIKQSDLKIRSLPMRPCVVIEVGAG
jgi:hypothetical protein